MQKRVFRAMCLLALLLMVLGGTASAHFQMIIPSNECVTADGPREITLDLLFWHPFEGVGMPMASPAAFGVVHRGKNTSLLGALAERKTNGHQSYRYTRKISRPGDYIFYVQPAPYWEPAEDKFIVHYTKTVVNGLGMEEGWDQEIGLEAEIVPLTRPYGLWAGNLFQGVVKMNGRPVPYAEIEVEYYNRDGAVKAPADPFITQVIKADSGGLFSYAMPRAGWWGFAALMEGSTTMKYQGQDKAVEVGAVLWVRTRDMK